DALPVSDPNQTVDLLDLRGVMSFGSESWQWIGTMGPPVVQGAPVVPKMGVRARMSDLSQRRDAQEGLNLSFLSQPPHSNKSLDPQPRSETTFPVRPSPSTSRSLARMKRSNSEVTISDVGAEDMDPAAINRNTGASLRRKCCSTSTLDRQSLSRSTETPSWRLEQHVPSAPPPFPEPPQLHAALSPSLQTAARIAHGDVIYVPDYVNASVYVSHVQKTKPETSILSRLRNQRTNRDISPSVISYKCFSHYDSQSVLFDFSSGFVHQADLQHRRNISTSGCDVFDGLSPDECEKNNFLVSSCPFFHNEIGGETERRLGLTRANTSTCGAAADTSFSNPPLSIRRTNASISVLEFSGGTRAFDQNLMNNHDIEHIDLGARYYLKYFYNQGKVHDLLFFFCQITKIILALMRTLSLRREKLEERNDETQYNYRMILRTGQLSTLRGSITEESIPSSSKHGTSRRLPLRDVLEFVVPQLSIHSLRLAADSPRVPELLLQLDQQELRFQRKVGVLFCRAGQSTEEDNSDSGSPALDQFLDLLGHRGPLKDTSDDSTGRQSVFTTFREFKLMFHVSTVSSPQQLLHKSLTGNDFVTVIFQEPNSPPFTPQNICSHSQHVFIIVRVHRPCSQHTCYSVAVSRHRDIPFFGPLIPPGWMFSASPEFRNFLLTKIINAENAAHRSETFVTITAQRRQEHLKELVENFSTSVLVDSSSSIKFSFISLGVKKKERSAPRPHAYLNSAGALTWSVTAKDFSCSFDVPCQLAVSSEFVVLVEEASRQVVFHCYCRDVIGWNAGHKGIKLFYEHGDCVMLSTRERGWEDSREIAQRLQLVTRGSPAVDMILRRNRHGQLGFHVNFEGVVADVETNSFAWKEGLRPGCRIMEICAVAIVKLSHKQMIELLRTSMNVSVVVILPHRDGTPRRSHDGLFELYFKVGHIWFVVCLLLRSRRPLLVSWCSPVHSGHQSDTTHTGGDITELRPGGQVRYLIYSLSVIFDITARSLSGEVLRLEEILQQLQLDLLKEQRDKAALQQQVLSLRQENHRLQMESHSAAKHIRRFAAWMLRQDSLP
uniref:Signal-induced proliferation-associated 1 like 2 n=1 Tax=Oreochromis niloticus TaxID=8128 RepID=A0A669CVS4_ORENI